MSNYGMLGLLGGMGSGMQKAGDNLMKYSLIEAEQQRLLNLEKIRREWNREDLVEQRAYDEKRDEFRHKRDWDDLEAIWNRKVSYEQDIHDRDRKEKLADTESDRRWQLENRQPSETDKKLQRARDALNSGQISQEQYNAISLGLDLNGGISAKDRIKIRQDNYKIAREDIMGVDSIEPPDEEQARAIQQRYNELNALYLGGGSEAQAQRYHPEAIASKARDMVRAGYDPAKDKIEQNKQLEAANIPATVIAEVLSQADKIYVQEQEKQKKEQDDKKNRARPGPPAQQTELSHQPGALVRAMLNQKPSSMEERRRRTRESFVREPPRLPGLLER